MKQAEKTAQRGLDYRSVPAARLGKYLRREVRDEAKRLAFTAKLICLFDQSFEQEAKRFHAFEPLNRFFENQYGLRSELSGSEEGPLNVGRLAMRTRPGNQKVVRRSLKLMRRQLRQDICRLVEKVQLLRALDPIFQAEIDQLGFTRALDVVSRWHAMSGRGERVKLRRNVEVT